MAADALHDDGTRRPIPQAGGTRERILDAAAALAAAGAAPEPMAVAAAAGVSRSTFYRHFADGPALLAAMREEAQVTALALIERHLRPVLEDEPGVSVLGAIGELCEWAFRERSRLRLVMGADVGVIAPLIDQFRDLGVGLIERAQRRGEVHADLAPAAVFTTLVGAVTSLIVEIDAARVDPDDAAVVVVRFLRGLR